MFTRWNVTSAIYLLLPVLVLSGLIAICAPSVVNSDTAPSVKAQKPEWKVGYWWEYSLEQPGSSGTRTYVMVREETFEGVPCYVMERGRRERFYTINTLGEVARTRDGDLESKRTPPYQLLSWPLEVGKKWENTYLRERLQEGSSRKFKYRFVVAKIEEVKVPAGTFEAFKIEKYNQHRNLREESWYSPKVKWWVRRRIYQRDGALEYALLGFGGPS